MQTDLPALAKRLVERAAVAYAKTNSGGATESILRLYREDSRTVTAAVLRAMLPVRKSAGEVVLELPELGRVPLGELIAAVEAVKVS